MSSAEDVEEEGSWSFDSPFSIAFTADESVYITSLCFDADCCFFDEKMDEKLASVELGGTDVVIEIGL